MGNHSTHLMFAAFFLMVSFSVFAYAEENVVDLSDARITDSFGAVISEINQSQYVQIASDITNTQNVSQDVIFSVTITDEKGQTTKPKSISMSLNPGQKFTSSVSWSPMSVGIHTINIQILENLQTNKVLNTLEFFVDVTESKTNLEESWPSVAKQLLSGTFTRDITCKSTYVLVLRTVVNPVCVTENTAQKMNDRFGWEIVIKSQKVENVKATNTVINYIDLSLYDSTLNNPTPDDSAFDPTSEITVLLSRQKILYESDRIYLTAVYPINTVPRYGVINSDGNYLLYPSQTFNKNSDIAGGFHMGHASFGTTWEPGEYTVLVTTEDTAIKKKFTIAESDCCNHLIQVKSDIYNPGDHVVFYPKITPLTISLINPDGETYRTKSLDKKKFGEGFKSSQTIIISKLAAPGIWTIQATDGNIIDSVELLVVPPPEGLIIQTTAKEIAISYNETLANKKPGDDVLLVSSLEPFVDDGRVYPPSRGMGGGVPKNMYNDISYIMKSSPFSVNDKGIVTVQSTDHERYSAKNGGGFYLEDWLPSHIPDGYKLLYAKTNDNAFLNFNSEYIGHSTYRFVSTYYTLQPDVTYRSFDRDVEGFTISVKRSTELNKPVEESISFWKKKLEADPYSYGGFVDMTRNGKTVYAFEGSDTFGQHKTHLFFHPDEYTSIHVGSAYLTIDELLPVFDSIIDYDAFEQTWGHVEVVRPEPKLVTYSDLYGNPLNTRGMGWSEDNNNVKPEFQPDRLPQYVPDALELGIVYISFDGRQNNGVEQFILGYDPIDSDVPAYENTVNGIQITISNFVKYDESLVRSFAVEKNMTLHEFNGRMAVSAEFENGSYLLFYDKEAQIELYSQKYNLDEVTKMAKSLIGLY